MWLENAYIFNAGLVGRARTGEAGKAPRMQNLRKGPHLETGHGVVRGNQLASQSRDSSSVITGGKAEQGVQSMWLGRHGDRRSGVSLLQTVFFQ